MLVRECSALELYRQQSLYLPSDWFKPKINQKKKYDNNFNINRKKHDFKLKTNDQVNYTINEWKSLKILKEKSSKNRTSHQSKKNWKSSSITKDHKTFACTTGGLTPNKQWSRTKNRINCCKIGRWRPITRRDNSMKTCADPKIKCWNLKMPAY